MTYFSNLHSFGWIVLLVIGFFVLVGALLWEMARRKRTASARHIAWKLHHDWLHGKAPPDTKSGAADDQKQP